ncbi:MAG: BatA domain-containing protein, partial [Balneolaceae bacterium]
MSFLNPLFLIALISVGIPLLIYLLNLRKPRKVLFSTLAFFDILKSTSLKRIKIKRWLLLAVRCAAIIMLVLAASRPFLPPLMGFEGGDNEPKSIGILVDNSPSMQQTDAGGPYFSQAISTAAAITSLARNGDRLYLEVTNGESMNSPGQTANTVKASLSDLEIKNAGNYTLQRLKNLAVRLADSPEPVNIIYLITDSQASQFADFDEINEKFESVSVQVFKVGSGAQNNVAVISTDMVSGRAGGDSEIHIETTVQNFSNTEIRNYFLSLEVDGELISQKIVNMDPGSTVQYKFEFIPHSDDLTKAKIVLEGDEYTFDNTRYVAIQSPETKNILVLQDDNRQRSFQSYLKPLLDAAVGGNGNLRVRYSALNTSIIGELNDFDTIVLDGLQEIPEYVVQELVQLIQQGNGMLFLPSATGDIANYNRFLQFAGADRFDNVIGSYGSFQAVDRLSVLTEGHPVLDEVFDKPEDEQLRINAPEIFYYYKQENSRAST